MLFTTGQLTMVEFSKLKLGTDETLIFLIANTWFVRAADGIGVILNKDTTISANGASGLVPPLCYCATRGIDTQGTSQLLRSRCVASAVCSDRFIELPFVPTFERLACNTRIGLSEQGVHTATRTTIHLGIVIACQYLRVFQLPFLLKMLLQRSRTRQSQ